MNEHFVKLKDAVQKWLTKLFDGSLPHNQPEGTAFAMAVTWEMRPTDGERLRLFGSPNKVKESPSQLRIQNILKSNGVKLEWKQWMVDFLVADLQSKTNSLPKVACESEMYGNFNVEYVIDADHGHVFDFCKLLHFCSPHLLFIGRVTHKRLVKLQESLQLCAREYHELWAGRTLSVILLPTSQKIDMVHVGVGKRNGAIEFRSLN